MVNPSIVPVTVFEEKTVDEIDGDSLLVVVDIGLPELIIVSVRVATLLIVTKRDDVLLVEGVLGAADLLCDALVVNEIDRIGDIDEEPDTIPTLLTLGEPV